ncbi:MAG: molybdopterin-dependent oxidoreductase [Anaerolineaceae bacterium]|nr:molybdopterin-dependent oxidoreductase [Anaerolineaceae bacterium]
MMAKKKQNIHHKEDESRLPPGQTLIEGFPILQYGGIPNIDIDQWQLRIWGAVENEVSLSWVEFNQLPKVELTLDLHCVTRWTKYETHWQGVPLQTMIDAGIIQPLPSAKFVIQHAPGYTTNLPLSNIMAENFLLATHYKSQPITVDHGWPLRGLIGAMPANTNQKDVYLWKGAKWLNGLEFSETDQPGFWERYGYNNEADVWKEQRFA